jgi:predicted RNase H-like HicB family nuclease
MDFSNLHIFVKKIMTLKRSYTAVIEKTKDGWYVGQIQEHPEAITQGKTLEELESNLSDALKEVLDMKKEEFSKQIEGKKVFRRKILV